MFLLWKLFGWCVAHWSVSRQIVAKKNSLQNIELIHRVLEIWREPFRFLGTVNYWFNNKYEHNWENTFLWTTAISVLDHKTFVHPPQDIPVKINLGNNERVYSTTVCLYFASPGGYKYLVGKTKKSNITLWGPANLLTPPWSGKVFSSTFPHAEYSIYCLYSIASCDRMSCLWVY